MQVTDARGATGLDEVSVVHKDGTVALSDVTLLARPGELVAVLGPSGSGKSTVLRVVAGLTPVTRGRVLIDGVPTTDEPSQRNVAMVFENTRLLPFLDVAHNMAFGLSSHHVPQTEAQDRVRSKARDLRVSKLLFRRPTGLSSGETGRVGIGRALVRRNPRAFLLDEPLAHLDAHERQRTRHVIAQTVRAAGVPTIYVTHDHTEALTIGDRVVVLREGRVVQVGTPRDVYDRPVDLFVAGFVGTVPIGEVDARLVATGAMAGYRIGMRTVPTWAPVPPELERYVGEPVVLGVRPEDVHDATTDPDPDTVTVRGLIRSIERTGPEAFVTLEVQGRRLVARFSGRTRVRAGEDVEVAIDGARAHVFDARTGAALWHPPG
jgi:multiple sugar transport system ATP-binding protein